jgi:pyruvate,water dikinase
MSDKPFLLWFKDIDKNDTAFVGGKGANLGEMVQAGFPVPDGFVVTAETYFYALDHNNLRDKIKNLLENVDVHDPHALKDASVSIKRLISHAEVPKEVGSAIISTYHKLGSNELVAIRSSATAEDLPGASFAGQQETFLNIRGDANVVDTVRDAWASLFEPRAIFYREQKGFDHFKVGIAVPVQKMIQSEVSGVMFTVNPVNNDKRIIVIEAIWGLGEKIVQGAITPDHYQVKKEDWSIYHKEIVEQRIQMVKKGNGNADIAVPKKLQDKPKMTDDQIIKLAMIGNDLHKHYFFPQDIEWAMEGEKLFILQTRPITTIEAVKKGSVPTVDATKATANLKKILSGDAASPGLVSGPVKVIKSVKEIGKVSQGDILVTEMTTPDFVPVMKKAAALVTDKGGQTSHAAIVSRELGLPCIVGTEDGTKKLKNGQVVTVNGKTGDIFDGGLPSKVIEVSSQKKEVVYKDRKTATKLYVNLAEPSLASEVGKKNVDGVGLLRAEFMIAEIGTHPRKFIEDKKEDLFIDKLAEGLRTFCLSFGERPVIYRATDFRTNEFRNLIGGKYYEPQEENPFIGLRGVYRYLANPEVFNLELEAIKMVRNKFGHKNLWLMLPFVRTVDELVRVKKLIASAGLNRSPSFKLWLMVEIPSNVILLEDFVKAGIDGVSIGSNDLTMLTLGVDRDNEELASGYDARDPAVLKLMEQTIKKAKKLGITSSICGQAPSLYPDLTQHLVSWGITSVSVSPDMIDQTREIIYESEKRKVRG